jgi:WD40 repeat protein
MNVRLQPLAALAMAMFLSDLRAGPDDKEIGRLITQLGSSDFRTREAAQKRLEEIGERALDGLFAATTRGDLESRRRAELLAIAIERKVAGPTLRVSSATPQNPAAVPISFSVSQDGKRIVTTAADGMLREWDFASGKCMRAMEVGARQNQMVSLAREDKLLLLDNDDNKAIRMLDAASFKEVRQLGTGGPGKIVYAPGALAITATFAGQAHVWDLDTGERIGDFPVRYGVLSLAYSPRAHLVATGHQYVYGRVVRLWNPKTGHEVHSVLGTSGNHGFSIGFSADGKQLLWTDGNGALRLCDTMTKKDVIHIANADANCAAFSPDSKWIISGRLNHDYSVRVWDAATGKELRKHPGHAAPVTSIAFYPDGRRAVSASLDGTVRHWPARVGLKGASSKNP